MGEKHELIMDNSIFINECQSRSIVKYYFNFCCIYLTAVWVVRVRVVNIWIWIYALQDFLHKTKFLGDRKLHNSLFLSLFRHPHFTLTAWTISIIIGGTFLLIPPMYSSSAHLSAFPPNDFLQNDLSVKSSSNLRLVSPPHTKRGKHSLQHTASTSDLWQVW